MRVVLPVLALSLLSATFSQADSPHDRRHSGQGALLGLASLPDLDRQAALDEPRSEPVVVPPYYNPRPQDIARFTPIIDDAAHRYGLDPQLLHAVIRAESGYRADALSPRGAVGLMQLLPETARRYGIKDLLNPRLNVRAGARYLRDLLEMFGNDLELALAAYNAGEGSVIRAGNRIPGYRETRAYVPKVLEFYRASGGET